MEGDEFDWYKGSEDAVIIKQVDAVAVYINPHMDVVIRQRSSIDEDDSVIIVPRQYVPTLIEALKLRLAEGG